MRQDRKLGLVVVRAGDYSLHPLWTDGERDWDLVVSSYGAFPDRLKGDAILNHAFKGTKWEGLVDFLDNYWHLVEAYEYVWFPDDDLYTDQTSISKFFELCKALNFTIAQPALTISSYASWDITYRVEGQTARLTDFVEIMAPCFKVASLSLFSKYFRENRSGFGFEWLWKAIAIESDCFRFGIVDATPIQHTRPVGSAGHGVLNVDPRIEEAALLNKFGLSWTAPRVLELL